MEDDGAGLQGSSASTWKSCKKDGDLVGRAPRRKGCGGEGSCDGEESGDWGGDGLTGIGLEGTVACSVRGLGAGPCASRGWAVCMGSGYVSSSKVRRGLGLGFEGWLAAECK